MTAKPRSSKIATMVSRTSAASSTTRTRRSVTVTFERQSLPQTSVTSACRGAQREADGAPARWCGERLARCRRRQGRRCRSRHVRRKLRLGWLPPMGKAEARTRRLDHGAKRLAGARDPRLDSAERQPHLRGDLLVFEAVQPMQKQRGALFVWQARDGPADLAQLDWRLLALRPAEFADGVVRAIDRPAHMAARRIDVLVKHDGHQPAGPVGIGLVLRR